MVRTRLALLLGLLGFAVLAGGAYIVGSRSNDDDAPAQTETAAWAAEVRTALANGDQDRVVATVDGQEIRMGTVTGLLASAHAIEGPDQEDPATAEQALDAAIDDALIAAVARRAGITVTDDEITAAIQAGTIDPYRAGKLTKEQKAAADAALALAGTDIDHALDSPTMRATVRDNLVRSKYLQQSGFDRVTVIAEARAAIPYEVVPGALTP